MMIFTGTGTLLARLGTGLIFLSLLYLMVNLTLETKQKHIENLYRTDTLLSNTHHSGTINFFVL